MANNLKDDAIGLSAEVKKLQISLHDKLSAKWGIEIEGYPICFDFIDRDGNNTIAHYLRRNEYLPLIHNDKTKFFFTSNYPSVQVSNYTFDTNIDLYFIIDLSKITIYDERATDEVLRDIIQVLNSGHFGIDTKIINDVNVVFDGYSFDKNIGLHPKTCFKITIGVYSFNLNKKGC